MKRHITERKGGFMLGYARYACVLYKLHGAKLLVTAGKISADIYLILLTIVLRNLSNDL